jgi:peptidoglycan/xylan/chitin deacetylase (PgdA/CDA1 family)
MSEANKSARISKTYYRIKPLIPRRVQIFLRRIKAFGDLEKESGRWPIDSESAGKPDGWQGWPNGKQFALVLTHDVDTFKGYRNCLTLSDIEKKMGFNSSFNFVPERYQYSRDVLEKLKADGFEIGVHGLHHDGKLYASKNEFLKRAKRINFYLSDWGASGFRSPSMQHNLGWMKYLDIEYDASTFDTDPFEPQPDGVKTIFPFWVKGNGRGKGFVELPYTLPQDFTVFIVLKQKDITIWEKKLEWIVEHGGMALLNTHPDYMAFNGKKPRYDEYDIGQYVTFLDVLQTKYRDSFWNPLPADMAKYVKKEVMEAK